MRQSLSANRFPLPHLERDQHFVHRRELPPPPLVSRGRFGHVVTKPLTMSCVERDRRAVRRDRIMFAESMIVAASNLRFCESGM